MKKQLQQVSNSKAASQKQVFEHYLSFGEFEQSRIENKRKLMDDKLDKVTKGKTLIVSRS